MSPFPDAVRESVLGGDTGGLAKLEDHENAYGGDDLSPRHHDDTQAHSGHSVTDRSSLATEVWAGTVAAIPVGRRREAQVGNCGDSQLCSVLTTAALQCRERCRCVTQALSYATHKHLNTANTIS